MKSPVAMLLGMSLITPALAQAPPLAPSAPNASVRYAPNAQRQGDGQYRAEVRRGGQAGDADEVAWSSAPHATLGAALGEACKMIETVYAPGARCPLPAGEAKKTAQPAPEGKSQPKPTPRNVAKAKLGAVSPVSGYEVRGCAFYSLVDGRVRQRCPSEGAPGTKPFWYNGDAFEGGYGGGGS